MRAVQRVRPCQPANYWQVWLVDAAGYALILFIVWAAFGQPLIGLVMAATGLIGRGAFQSYRLGRRMDHVGATHPWSQPGEQLSAGASTSGSSVPG